MTTDTFSWISSEPQPREYITVDAMQRLYLSADAARLLRIDEFPAKVVVGYDKVNRRIIVGKAEIVRPADVKPFNFDRRRYTYAKPFVRAAGIDVSALPQRYNYAGKDYADIPKGAHSFELAGYRAPDNAR